MRSSLKVKGACIVKRYIREISSWGNQAPFIILIKRVEQFFEVLCHFFDETHGAKSAFII